MSPEREPFANPDLVCGSNSNKVRIIALYIQYREGVPEEDRRRLYQHARLTRPEMDAVNALVHLGVRITRVRPAHSLTISDAVRSQYAWSRGQETKTSNGASGRNSLLKTNTSSRDTNLYSAPSSRYAVFFSLLVLPHCCMHTHYRTKSQGNLTQLHSRTSKTTRRLPQPRPAPGQRPHRRPRCGAPSPAGTARRARAERSPKRASGCSCSLPEV